MQVALVSTKISTDQDHDCGLLWCLEKIKYSGSAGALPKSLWGRSEERYLLSIKRGFEYLRICGNKHLETQRKSDVRLTVFPHHVCMLWFCAMISVWLTLDVGLFSSLRVCANVTSHGELQTKEDHHSGNCNSGVYTKVLQWEGGQKNEMY